MKKIFIIISVLLVIVLVMLYSVRKDNLARREVAGEKIQNQQQVNSGNLKVTFLDVGQGDAEFIEFPDSEQMLVDCSQDGRILEALGRVMPYYDKEIDYLLITHPDLDHYGGCEDVLNKFTVKNIAYSGLKKENDKMWLSFWQAVKDENANDIEIKKEDLWTVASTTLHFLYPDHQLGENKNLPGSKKAANDNNTSIVFRISYNNKSILMVGDAEIEEEKYLLDTYGSQLDSDVLKVAHHGSESSSGVPFLDSVTPQYSIISCGLNNKFSHPSLRTLKKLERVHSQIFRTDLQRDICLTIGDDLVVEECSKL